MKLDTLNRKELTFLFNVAFNRNVAPTSYTKGKLVEALDDANVTGIRSALDQGRKLVAAGETPQISLEKAIANDDEWNANDENFENDDILNKDAETPRKKTRRILNPQPKLEAKKSALKAIGVQMVWDIHERVWWIGEDPEEFGFSLSSREVAGHTPASLVELLQK